jgi:hypothetical protein
MIHVQPSVGNTHRDVARVMIGVPKRFRREREFGDARCSPNAQDFFQGRDFENVSRVFQMDHVTNLVGPQNKLGELFYSFF